MKEKVVMDEPDTHLFLLAASLFYYFVVSSLIFNHDEKNSSIILLLLRKIIRALCIPFGLGSNIDCLFFPHLHLSLFYFPLASDQAVCALEICNLDHLYQSCGDR